MLNHQQITTITNVNIVSIQLVNQRKKMAKSKVDFWLTEEGLTSLEQWSRNGLTHVEIAQNMGINPCTLYDYMNKHPKIANALKKSRQIADALVENALFQKALSGDTTAQIFYLKNRKPNNWRDKQQQQVDVNANVVSIEEYFKSNKLEP